MTLVRTMAAAALAVGISASAAPANAALVFVGSWQVDQGPGWSEGENGPLAYTAQEAAAYLFGGTAGKYVISTAGKSVGAIDHQAWYSVLGIGAGVFDEDYSAKYLGLYYGPGGDHGGGTFGPVSAFVNDWATGARFTNYAFREATITSGTPEPGAWALMILGFGTVGAIARRQRRPAAGQA